MPDGSDRFDVAIIGGNATGCAIAYALARRKVAAVLVDQAAPGGYPTGTPSGRLWVHTHTPPAYVRLCQRSAHGYAALQEEIGPIEFRPQGGLSPAWTESDVRAGMRLVEQQASAGLDVHWLSRDDVLKTEPGLSPDVLGATASPYDGGVNPLLLVRRLVAASRRLGGGFFFHCGYVAAAAEAGGYRVRTGRGEFRAPHLVFAGTAGMIEIAHRLGVVLPVRLHFTYTVVTEALPVLLHHMLPAVQQDPSGKVVLESTEDLHLPNGEMTVQHIQAIARRGIRWIPSLATARVLRTCHQAEIMSEDTRPIIGQMGDRIHGAVISRDLSLCPLVGDAVAQEITKGRLPEGFGAFGVDRFRLPARTAQGHDLREDSHQHP
jgi:glycine/D-amino acid oxidase-like deaminating enzyme